MRMELNYRYSENFFATSLGAIKICSNGVLDALRIIDGGSIYIHNLYRCISRLVAP